MMGKTKVALIVTSWVIPISILVNRIVPEPYMDEIFHVPQAQQYCKGNFRSWDPMITTPPGLYILSLAPIAYLLPGSLVLDVCSTGILRSINGVLAVICSITVYEIFSCLRPDIDERKKTMYAVVLALYPLHWFFTFLYYTDVASLTLVLAMYVMCLKNKYIFSALLGALSVLVRQTNIIWVIFVACSGVIDYTTVHHKYNKEELANFNLADKKNLKIVPNKGVNTGSTLRKRRLANFAVGADRSIPRTTSVALLHSPGLYNEIKENLLTSWHLKWELLVSFSPFFLVVMAFVVFVLWNGSIVLGAKEAHAVSPHLAQSLYFSLVSSLFMLPIHFSLSRAEDLVHSLWKNKPLSFIKWFIALVAGFISVHFFSVAHPYLIADNRHYTFYLWRRIIKAHWSMKYILVPLYVYSWFSISSILAKSQKKIWVLAYYFACAAVLVPAPLIEFRYYTIPFFFLILHSRIDDNRSWVIMGIVYMAINIFTMIMFLFRPFKWDHEAGIQRFIW